MCFERGGFDVVLGNPPWGQKEIAGEQLITKFVRGTYRSVSGIFDWFRPFVEREFLLLRSNGRYGVVLPDTILLKNYESTRRYFLENTSIESITWWGPASQQLLSMSPQYQEHVNQPTKLTRYMSPS